MLKPPNRSRDRRSSDQNILFVPRIKTKKGGGSFFWCYQNRGIVSPVKLELQIQFNLLENKFKKNILTKIFRPSSFVSWHAQLMIGNEITTMILNTSSDFRANELGTPKSWAL